MPNVDLKPMDYGVLRCLDRLQVGDSGVLSAELTPCLTELFPDNEEVEMRQGESITRLRGRQYVSIDDQGRLSLTALGAEHMTESLPLKT